MDIFDIFKRKGVRRKELSSYYTDVHSAGFAFKVKGRDANLWIGTNPKGEVEYFVLDREICWNAMCGISNTLSPFIPDPDDCVYHDIDVSQILRTDKVVNKAWFFITLV